MKKALLSTWYFFYGSGLLCLLLLQACGTVPDESSAPGMVGIEPAFQTVLSPVPTPPPYRCGAWTSNNGPGSYSTIIIYAKLTHDLAGVSDSKAKAVIHFRGGDAILEAPGPTDRSGYISFTLPLQGRQPRMDPATVEVFFTVKGQRSPIQCSTFFTPV